MVATFEDGSSEVGHLLVGCDGSRSKVREHLLGPKAKPMDSEMNLVNHAISGLSKEQALEMAKYHPVIQMAYIPDVIGLFLLGRT